MFASRATRKGELAPRAKYHTGSLFNPAFLRFAAEAAAARSHGFQPVVSRHPKPRAVNTALDSRHADSTTMSPEVPRRIVLG